MDSQRPNDVSPEAMQARIQQARREAEGLKDRIKRKKDELADTSRKFISQAHRSRIFSPSQPFFFIHPKMQLHRGQLSRRIGLGNFIANVTMHSSRCGSSITRGDTKESVDEDEENTQGTFGQDLRYALVHRSEAFGFCLARRKIDYLGRLHHQ